MLKPLETIFVPPPKPEKTYDLSVFGQRFVFKSLKELLGAADISKAGDRNAGLSARSEVEREAARTILSQQTLLHLYENPLTDASDRVDSVQRVNYDIDLREFHALTKLTVGQLKDRLLAAEPREISKIGSALTGTMAAAVTKLLDTHELIAIASRCQRSSFARTTLGLPNTLSSRLQPNHPTDDLRGITLLVYAGLSLGSGDALIGVNPAIDTVENVSTILQHLAKLREHTQAPTQYCVLSHIKTQLACLKKGVPVEILFQSLAGTEATNLTEFDISVELLDEAYRAGKDHGFIEGAKQFMYFETGQGSEFTYQKHNGIDMTTTEALCYGLARRYDPFMVNNVTGFIGPETHLDNFEVIYSNLQDHFMGKLLGLPMGMAPCYTLHSKITLEGQQMATQLLTAAGANYYMDVYLNTDRMLAYFDTSAHDNQTLREIYHKTPTPEYFDWAIQRGILKEGKNGGALRGPSWGDLNLFVRNRAELSELTHATPALYGFACAGPRPSDAVTRELKLHQAMAREATYSDLDLPLLAEVAKFVQLSTHATSRESHLNSPSLGAKLDETSRELLTGLEEDIQVVISDGLSAFAVNANIPELLPVLLEGLQKKGCRVGPPILVPFGRVKLAEDIAECANAKLIVLLIGERPGGDADAAKSLSCYLVYRITDPQVQQKAAHSSGHADIRFEYTVLSNIYSKGTPPIEAASLLVEKAVSILEFKAAGNRLESLLNA